MGLLIKIEFEKKHSVKDIQDKFRKHLSEKVILSATTRALNETATRVQGHIRKEIRKEYTINNKYLNRASQTSKKATPTAYGLFANVSFKSSPIPMIGFKNNAQVGKRRPISVTVMKGRPAVFKRAFAATFVSGHTGIYEQGYYNKGKFVHVRIKTKTGRTNITELKAPSPFGMALTERMKPKITKYVDNYLSGRVKFFLEQQLSRMRK